MPLATILGLIHLCLVFSNLVLWYLFIDGWNRPGRMKTWRESCEQMSGAIMTLKKRRRICSSVICVGFVIALLALYFNHVHQDSDSGAPAMVFGSGLIFFGYCYYLWSKGYNPALGFLIFLIGPIAFIVFWMLPDKANSGGN